MKSNRLLLLCVLALAMPESAEAYVGPGAGVGAFGAALALISGVVLVIVGFIWYPFKRLLRAISARRAKSENAPADHSTQ